MQYGADADIYTDKKRLNCVACNVNQWDLFNSIIDSDIKLYKYHCHSVSSIICLSKMRLKWSKHIMQCNPMLIERWINKRSSEDVRCFGGLGRSFLHQGTVKVKLLETNVPQKILMIRFETHWFL